MGKRNGEADGSYSGLAEHNDLLIEAISRHDNFSIYNQSILLDYEDEEDISLFLGKEIYDDKLKNFKETEIQKIQKRIQRKQDDNSWRLRNLPQYSVVLNDAMNYHYEFNLVRNEGFLDLDEKKRNKIINHYVCRDLAGIFYEKGFEIKKRICIDFEERHEEVIKLLRNHGVKKIYRGTQAFFWVDRRRFPKHHVRYFGEHILNRYLDHRNL